MATLTNVNRCSQSRKRLLGKVVKQRIYDDQSAGCQSAKRTDVPRHPQYCAGEMFSPLFLVVHVEKALPANDRADKTSFRSRVTDDTFISSEMSLEVADVTNLCVLLDLNARDRTVVFMISTPLVSGPIEFCGIEFNPPTSATVTLRAWHRLDQLPYKIHTGRELAMMLAEKKAARGLLRCLPERCDLGGDSGARF